MNFFAYHNSRLLDCRFPHGALKCRGEAALCIYLSGRDAARARASLRLWADGKELLIPAEKISPCSCEKLRSLPLEGDGGFCFSFNITAPAEPQLIWYYFIIDVAPEHDGGETTRLFYGAPETRSGIGKFYPAWETPPDYQITVFARDFETPSWFRHGIVYQIFPDRFNRECLNDSARGTCIPAFSRAEYHEKLGRRIIRHKDWFEPVLYSPCAGEKFYSPCDYYGGDFAGIKQKLPYLAQIGVSVIYLNPIFEAASNHRYNTSDYLSVDPILGSDYDLTELSKAAAEYGIRLMADGVFSHTGDDSVYFNKYGTYPSCGAYSGADSPYYKWYEFEHFPDEYRCWWGFKTLPEVNELQPDYVRFTESVLKKWAGCGITSWRLDVADELPDEFIKKLRTALKKLDSDGVLLGEVWEDASNKVSGGGLRKFVLGDELDSVMNYPFRDAVCDFLTCRTDAYALYETLSGQRERYPEPFYGACMNLLGSHDTQRILSCLSDAPPKDTLTREQQAEYQYKPEAVVRGKRRLYAAFALMFSMPQPPCIYYGDEAGMMGLSDPFNRGSYPWGREDIEIRSFVMQLSALRRRNAAMSSGKTAFAAPCADAFAVLRCRGEESALTLVNRADHAVCAALSAEDFREGPDALNVRTADKYSDAFADGTVLQKDLGTGHIRVEIPPNGFLLLLSQTAE